LLNGPLDRLDPTGNLSWKVGPVNWYSPLPGFDWKVTWVPTEKEKEDGFVIQELFMFADIYNCNHKRIEHSARWPIGLAFDSEPARVFHAWELWSVFDGEWDTGPEGGLVGDPTSGDTFGFRPSNRVELSMSFGWIIILGKVYWQKAEYEKNPNDNEAARKPHDGWPFWEAQPKPTSWTINGWSSGKEPDPKFLIDTGLSRVIYEKWGASWGLYGWAMASKGAGGGVLNYSMQSFVPPMLIFLPNGGWGVR
jgi:hypothetical protein